ncbi:MAG: peptidase S8, partial [Propionibacterium sp.]|nr:peptidase S8 [Propionibacterium sp.]
MRSRKLLAAAGVLALILPVSVATADEPGGGDGLASLIARAPSGEIRSGAAQDILDARAKITIMVELKDDPVAVVKAKKGGELDPSEERKVENELSGVQNQVAASIEAKG